MAFTSALSKEEKEKFEKNFNLYVERLQVINPEISHVEIFKFISGGLNDVDPKIPGDIRVVIGHKDGTTKCVYFPAKDFPAELYNATYNQYLRLVVPEAVSKQDNTPLSHQKSVWLGDFL